MAHEISIDKKGNAEAFFANKPAWHGLGTVLDHAPTSSVAITAASLDWAVHKTPLFTQDGVEVPGWYATRRGDNNEVLGVVSEKYKIVNNQEAFSFLDSLCQDGLIKYESAGALKGGRVVWLLARMPSDDVIVKGDQCHRYVLFSTSHDGTAAIHAIPTSVRVVCANTLRIATSGDCGFSHTGNVARKLEQARMYLSQFDEQFTLFRDNARVLVSSSASQSNSKDYLNQLFPEIADENKKRLRTLRQRQIDRILENMKAPTNTIRGIKGTWWALFNSVTELVDHGREAATTAARESRMQSGINGPAAEFKSRAFSLALDMVG